MKSLTDIVVLSVAFWVAAIKLLVALNPIPLPIPNRNSGGVCRHLL